MIYREYSFVLGNRLIANFDNRPELRILKMPTLIIVGRHDMILPVNHSQALSDYIPNSRLAIFEESGHIPFAEEPARFVQVIRDFVAERRPLRAHPYSAAVRPQ